MPGRIGRQGRQGRLGRRLIAAAVAGILVVGLPSVATGADPDPAAERAAHMRAIVEKMRAVDHTHPDGSTHQHSGGMAALSAADLRFLGVRPGSGVCAGMYEVADAAVGHSCTHGFDATEPTATTPKSMALAATCYPIKDPGSCPKPAGWKVPNQIPCYGSGPFVEVMYLHWGTNRFPDYRERIRRSIAWVDLMFQVSAAAVKNSSGTAGNRHVRWAMAAGCKVKVTPVLLPDSTAGDIGSIKKTLVDAGRIVSTTKYLAFVDEGGCYGGIAELQNDSKPTSTNRSNNGGSFGMLDMACTQASDYASVVAAHELTHTLGAVQFDAPHTTGGHCWDDLPTAGYGADIMCYDDGEVATSKFYLACEITIPETFDCGKDDYFNPYPKSGNYLYTHWNTASNRYLATAEPPAWDTISTLSVALQGDGSKIGGTASIAATVTAPNGLTVDHVQFLIAGKEVASDATAPYGFTLATLPIPNLANVKVDAIAYDQYGMPGAPGSASYTVANPQVHLDVPVVNLFASPYSNWSATASAAGGRTVSKVEFIVDGTVVDSDSTKPYGGPFDFAGQVGFDDGIRAIEVAARVTDSAGVIRTTATRPMWIGSPSGAVAPLSTYPIPLGVTTRLQAVVDPAPGVPISKVEFLLNGFVFGSDTSAPYAFDWAPILGTWQLSARIIDEGGYSEITPSSSLMVVNSVASVTLDSPSDGLMVDGPVTVRASAIPPQGGTLDSISVLIDGLPVGYLPLGSVPFEADFAVGHGDHFVRIGAEGSDPNGWSLGSGNRLVHVDGPDVTITPGEGAVVRQSVDVGATVTDLPPGGIVYRIEFYQGGTLLGTDDTAPFSVPWDTLQEPDGKARLRAVALTSNGDIKSAIRTVTKRNLRAWFTSPLSGDTVSGPVTFKAGGKCDTDCVLENATIRVDGVPVKYDNTAPYWFTWDSTTAADGPHTYSVTFSTSDARAASTINFPFVVDNTP